MKVPAVLKPALHTLWQSLAAGLVTWWGSVNLGEVHGVSDVKRLAISGTAAGIAALLSAGLHVAKQYGPTVVRSLLRGRVNKAELALIDQALNAAADRIPDPTTTGA